MKLLYHLQLLGAVVLLSVSALHPRVNAEDTSFSSVTPVLIPTTIASTNTKPSSTSEPKKDIGDCPDSCTCIPSTRLPGTLIDCSESNLKSIPNLSKYSNVTQIDLSNNLIEVLEVGYLPTSQLLNLDLSNNRLKRVVTNKKAQLNQLREFNVSGNQLQDWPSTIGALKLSSLDSLDISNNPIPKLGSNAFDNCKNVTRLRMSQLTSLTDIHQSTFRALSNLKALKLASGSLKNLERLDEKLFNQNYHLQILNLSNNSLVEVPDAIRELRDLRMLFMDQNLMTSLRQSDFINLYNLTTLSITECPKLTNIDDHTFSDRPMLRFLILSNNPRLRYISADSFKSSHNITVNLAKLDLSGNNLSFVTDPRLFASLNLLKVDMSRNPLHCDCNIKWITNLPQLTSPVHCGSPKMFKDLEVGAFFATNDCETVLQPSYHTIILIGFLLFLTGLLVAVFVQRSESCRRLLWKDQYGTIYYTKASFQPETV